jgi:16S rRNA (cytosine1402-N4)-methyltransferase
MIATIIPDMRSHYPVLLSEIISIIRPQYGGTFIDCTFGQGGYTKKILNFKNTKVIDATAKRLKSHLPVYYA